MKKINFKITFKSIEKNIEIYLMFIKKILNKFQIKYKQLNLPKKKKRITLLKSPHVNKKALEHFNMFSYKKSLYINELHIGQKFKILKFLILNKPKFIRINFRKII